MVRIDDKTLAYSEVYAIINMMNQKDKDKIPNRFMDIIKAEMNSNYVPNINPKQKLKQQNLQPKTFSILAMLYLNYWCESSEKKDELIKIYAENGRIKEQKLREKYNPEELFENKLKETRVKEQDYNSNLPIEVKQKNIFKKIREYIRSFLNRK